jgi:hypothetical protein
MILRIKQLHATVAFAGPEEDGVVVERIRMNSF